MSAGDSRNAAEKAARASYGRLLAILTAKTRDIQSAEDALAYSFEAALKYWPERGIPDQPEAWLLTTAKRQLIDEARHTQMRERRQPELALLFEDTSMDQETAPLFPDERLKLLFVCAHPAIDRHLHAPLMLQTVLGFDAQKIASAFLLPPTTMAQRLVRAKAKIRAAAIPFEIPKHEDLLSRLASVLEAIYVTYSAGWDDPEGGDAHTGLASEALWLARLVSRLLPEEAEPKGLHALILYAEARRPARHKQSTYIPLHEQDTSLWRKEMIRDAEQVLLSASKAGLPGRFQLEAAIQSAHCHGQLAGSVNWSAIIILYAQLIEASPSAGAYIGQASAVALSGRPEDALRLLDRLAARVDKYQPYWAAKAYCHSQLAQIEDAAAAYNKAISLCTDSIVKEWLAQQKRSLDEQANKK